MSDTTPTVGDELPDDLKSTATPAVLDLTMEDAYRIDQEGGDWPEGFTQKDADSLDDLYTQYLQPHKSDVPNAAFWNKPLKDNQAIWAQKNS